MKSTIYLISVILIFIFYSVNSSYGYLWEKTFGGSDTEWAGCAQQTNDGGYIIVGDTYSYGAGGSDIWLIKTDSSGNHIWNKTFGGSSFEEGRWVQQTSDDGYIIVGLTESFGAGQADVYLVKTDAGGNKVWSKTFGGTGWDYASTVQQTSDGGYIIGGTTYSFYPEGYWLIKTNSSGILQWDSIFADPEAGHQYESTSEAWQTGDGGYILVGQTDPEYGAGRTYGTHLIKTDASGNQQWWKSWPYDYTANSVQQTKDGGYIMVGSDNSPPYDKPNGIWLVKTDSNGNESWSKNLAGYGGVSVKQTQDGGYIIVSGKVDGLVLIKTGTGGNLVWSKTFGGVGTASSVQLTSDGGYIIAAETPWSSGGNFDF